MSPSYFLACFPEFRRSDQVLVATKLAAAAVRMGMAGDGVNVWGPFAPIAATVAQQTMTTADWAQGNLAAHYVITSPFGTDMKLDPKSKGRSSYLAVFEDLELSVAGGIMVAGAVT